MIINKEENLENKSLLKNKINDKITSDNLKFNIKNITVLIFIILAFIGWISVFNKENNIKNIIKYNKNLLKSFIENNDYQYYETSNEIKWLISKIPKDYYTYLTINFQLGFFNDPSDYEGIIDIWRHLLMKGTNNILKDISIVNNKKYDISFKTDTNKTNFFINVKFYSEYFFEILDFIKNKINNITILKGDLINEFKSIKNKNNWKYIKSKNNDLMILLKSISNKDSVIFKDGTKEYDEDDSKTIKALTNTLKVINTNYISSNIMTTTIFTSENLDKNELIQNLETFKNFKIDATNKNKFKMVENFPKNLYGNLVVLKSNNYESPRLSFLYEINVSKFQFNKGFNLKLFKYLMDLNGPKSLNNILKIEEEFIYNMDISNLFESGGQKLVHIQFELTEKGFKNIDKIISYYYYFIDYLKRNDFEELIKSLSKISKYSYFFNIEFNNKIIKNYQNSSIKLAENLQFFTLREIYDLNKIFEIKNLIEFKEFLDNFDFSKSIFIFQSNKFRNTRDDGKNRQYRYYLSWVEDFNNSIINNENLYDEHIFKINYKKMPLDKKLDNNIYYNIFKINPKTFELIIKYSHKLPNSINIINNIKNIPFNFEILTFNCKDKIKDFEYNVSDLNITKNNFYFFTKDIIKDYQIWLFKQDDYKEMRNCLAEEIKNDYSKLMPDIIYQNNTINLYNKIFRTNFNFLSSIVIEIESKVLNENLKNNSMIFNSITLKLISNYLQFMVKKNLEEFILQGYYFECYSSSHKLVIKVIGIKENLFNFMMEIIKIINSDFINIMAFNLVKKKLFNDLISFNNLSNNEELTNYIFEQIYDVYSLNFIEFKNSNVFFDLFNKINNNFIKKIIPNIFKNSYLNILYFGNYSDNQSLNHKSFYESLGNNNTNFQKLDFIYENKDFDINEHHMIRLESFNKFDKNSVYFSYIILDIFNNKNKFIFTLINHIFSNNLNIILEEKALPIITSESILKEINFEFGILIKIVGTNYSPYYIEELVENAWFKTLNFLKTVDYDEFNNLKTQVYDKMIYNKFNSDDSITKVFKNIQRSKINKSLIPLPKIKDSLKIQDIINYFNKYFIDMQRRLSIEIYQKNPTKKILSKSKTINGVTYKWRKLSYYLKK